MRRVIRHLLQLGLASSLLCWEAPACADSSLAVIVAPGSGHEELNPADLAQIFKRKRRFWPNGQRIQPVNLPAGNALRRAFSQEVFGLTPEEMDAYWRDEYFHGELPPYVLNSEEAVIRFVVMTPGAIGYISHCLVDRRISVIARIPGAPACTK